MPSGEHHGPLTYAQAMLAARRAYLLQVLDNNGWVMRYAAQEAGVHRSHIYKLISEAGITLPEWVRDSLPRR